MAVRSASCTRFHCRTAEAFWRDALASADRGERIVLGAFDGEELIGTVTLVLEPRAEPAASRRDRENDDAGQSPPPRHRHGAAARSRAIAIERGRWLLVLDTAEDEGAAGLYERMGFKLAGLIPDYALKPHGGLTGTLIYWKRLQEPCRLS